MDRAPAATFLVLMPAISSLLCSRLIISMGPNLRALICPFCDVPEISTQLNFRTTGMDPSTTSEVPVRFLFVVFTRWVIRILIVAWVSGTGLAQSVGARQCLRIPNHATQPNPSREKVLLHSERTNLCLLICSTPLNPQSYNP